MEQVLNHIQELRQENISLQTISYADNQIQFTFEVQYGQDKYQFTTNSKYIQKFNECVQLVSIIPTIPGIKYNQAQEEQLLQAYQLIFRTFFRYFFEDKAIELSFLPRNFLKTQDINELNQFLSTRNKQVVENVAKQGLNATKQGLHFIGQKLNKLGKYVEQKLIDDTQVEVEQEIHDDNKEQRIDHEAEEVEEQTEQSLDDIQIIQTDIQQQRISMEYIMQKLEKEYRQSGQLPFQYYDGKIQSKSLQNLQNYIKQIEQNKQKQNKIKQFVNYKLYPYMQMYLSFLDKIQQTIKKYWQEQQDLSNSNKQLVSIQQQIAKCNKQKTQQYNSLIMQMNEQICIIEQGKAKINTYKETISQYNKVAEKFYSTEVKEYLDIFLSLINSVGTIQ